MFVRPVWRKKLNYCNSSNEVDVNLPTPMPKPPSPCNEPPKENSPIAPLNQVSPSPLPLDPCIVDSYQGKGKESSFSLGLLLFIFIVRGNEAPSFLEFYEELSDNEDLTDATAKFRKNHRWLEKESVWMCILGNYENESKEVSDAVFLGEAFAEALNEHIESSVKEYQEKDKIRSKPDKMGSVTKPEKVKSSYSE
nr:hypothetical protein [Tanacetum cinerariifolium]